MLVAGQDRIHLTVVGESTALQLREHQFAVLGHFEGPPVTRDEQQGFDPVLVLLEQLLRQTGGSRLVVSDSAVGQLDLHVTLQERGSHKSRSIRGLAPVEQALDAGSPAPHRPPGRAA